MFLLYNKLYYFYNLKSFKIYNKNILNNKTIQGKKRQSKLFLIKGNLNKLNILQKKRIIQKSNKINYNYLNNLFYYFFDNKYYIKKLILYYQEYFYLYNISFQTISKNYKKYKMPVFNNNKYLIKKKSLKKMLKKVNYELFSNKTKQKIKTT